MPLHFLLSFACAIALASTGGAYAQQEGSLKWGGGFSVGQNQFISSSPAIAPDGNIIVGTETFNGGRLIAINPAGTHAKWFKDFRRGGYFFRRLLLY